ncbi:MAG: hypothetical protein LBK53_04585 [Heliobacteriaceae bacterium]|jgi:hypothetical protein|nr:hypothetical protein [Heliobacteriaceae bacterium]
MLVSSIQTTDCHRKNTAYKQPCFQASFVTLSQKNLGKHISENIVGVFNKGIYQSLKGSEHLAQFENIAKNADFFTLAAGEGSRFRKLAQTYTDLTGIPANKISLPVPLTENTSIHMLDWGMVTGIPFAKTENGIQSIIAADKSGSFGDIYKYYAARRDKIKDVIVCCGDNVFGAKRGELLGFIKDVIENPNLRLGLIGAKKTPHEAAKRFGVLKVGNTIKNDRFHLAGFAEKPSMEEIMASGMLTPDGNCVANTGMFVIKKDAMEALMSAVDKNPKLIAKAVDEPYDFANAVKWVQKEFGEEKSAMKVVDTWEDVGEPQALYRFLNDIKNKKFLGEFGNDIAAKIQNAVRNRFQYDGKTGSLLLNGKYTLTNVPKSIKDNAVNIEGVDIMV